MKQKIIELLNSFNISFQVFEHPPLFTCEDAKNLKINIPATDCKTLFLTDGKKFFLLSMLAHKRLDVKNLSHQLNTTRLSFAKATELLQHLQLTPGSVSPFGLINDTENKVECLLDMEMMKCQTLGFHPLINTATLTLSPECLTSFLEKIKKDFKEVDV